MARDAASAAIGGALQGALEHGQFASFSWQRPARPDFRVQRASAASVNGTCSSEQDGDSHSLPWRLASSGCSTASAASRSVRQMLRPSTMPTDSTLCTGSQSAMLVSSCGAHAVHVQAGHGQAAGQAEVFFQRREIGGQQQRAPA
jgi:hypothetical protein